MPASMRRWTARAQMVAEGACIIDVGGESTRPGAAPVDAAVECERVVPVIERIAAGLDVAISIDSSKPSVMAAAVAAGACIVNDVRALRAPGRARMGGRSRGGRVSHAHERRAAYHAAESRIS